MERTKNTEINRVKKTMKTEDISITLSKPLLTLYIGESGLLIWNLSVRRACMDAEPDLFIFHQDGEVRLSLII
jgi:hypothetical protein